MAEHQPQHGPDDQPQDPPQGQPPPTASRAAIITGGSAGIGLATARLLAGEGWRVLLVGRDADRLQRAADGLDGAAVACPADVGESTAPRAIVACALEAFGRIDALVNNAGTAPLVPIAETTAELVSSTFSVNAIGPACLVLAALEHLRASGGRVVNVSSAAVRDPFEGFFAYAASKAAVEVMVRSIAKEAAPVRAFAVAPGAVETAMLRSIVSESVVPASATLAPEDVARVIADCCLGRRDADNGRTIEVLPPD